MLFQLLIEEDVEDRCRSNASSAARAELPPPIDVPNPSPDYQRKRLK